MRCKVIQKIEYEFEIDDYDEEHIDKIVENLDLIDNNGIIFDIKADNYYHTEMYDDDGNKLLFVKIMEGKNKEKFTYYKPSCKYGCGYCTSDINYLKIAYPVSYKKLALNSECEKCDREDYFDEF